MLPAGAVCADPMLKSIQALIGLLWAATAGASTVQGPGFLPAGTCWGRVYTASHLSAHPVQTVNAIHVWHETGERKHVEWHAPTPEAEPGAAGATGADMSAQLYIQSKDSPDIRSERIRCTALKGKLACKLPANAGDPESEPELLISPRGAAIQLERTTSWALRSLKEHVQTPGGLAVSPMPLSKDDVFFRLDSLPAEACHAVERTHAASFAQTPNPPLLHDLNRSPRMCLTGRGRNGMAISLYFDSSMGDWPDGIDRFNFNVTQVVGGQRVKTHLSCNAFDYAWRCQWQASDERPGAPNVGFASQTGPLVREPGGAVLHGVPCLAGYCADPVPAQAKAIRFQRSVLSECGN